MIVFKNIINWDKNEKKLMEVTGRYGKYFHRFVTDYSDTIIANFNKEYYNACKYTIILTVTYCILMYFTILIYNRSDVVMAIYTIIYMVLMCVYFISLYKAYKILKREKRRHIIYILRWMNEAVEEVRDDFELLKSIYEKYKLEDRGYVFINLGLEV